MLDSSLQPDTQAILLLCGSFGQNRNSNPAPLTLGEYNTLAGWLRDNRMTPKDLLTSDSKQKLATTTINKLDCERIIALLERGLMLSLALEKWTSQGLWILGRSDINYPKRLKEKLQHLAPAILYGIGNQELLSQGGLAIVGSRDVDEIALKYTKNVADTCANQGLPVISGGARGVDQASMLATLEAGGTTLGILADSLAKAAVDSKYRRGIREGQLTLISPYDPHAGFNTGNAMARNKYIYALSDYALVISSAFGSGGTWAGATEALQKIKNFPVFIRIEENVPQGNHELINKGARRFPQPPWNMSLKQLLEDALSENLEHPVTDSFTQTVIDFYPEQPHLNQHKKELEPEQIPEESSKIVAELPYNAEALYQTILPFILNNLQQPQNEQSLAEFLDVQVGQIRIWLKRALQEGKIIKDKNTYEINSNPNLSLPLK